MFNRLHHIAYRCENARETVDFYTNVLGMKLAAAVTNDVVSSIQKYAPHAHIFFEMDDGSYIAFFELLDKSEPHVPVANDWAQHLALQLDDREAVAALLTRLRARGVEIVGPECHGGIIDSWYFYDPNGHRLEIVVPTGGKDVWDKLERESAAKLDGWDRMKADHAAA